MTHVLQLFILRLRLRSTAEGRSFSWPNIRLRPKVKIVPTVQHWYIDGEISSKKLKKYSVFKNWPNKLFQLPSALTFLSFSRSIEHFFSHSRSEQFLKQNTKAYRWRHFPSISEHFNSKYSKKKGWQVISNHPWDNGYCVTKKGWHDMHDG